MELHAAKAPQVVKIAFGIIIAQKGHRPIEVHQGLQIVLRLRVGTRKGVDHRLAEQIHSLKPCRTKGLLPLQKWMRTECLNRCQIPFVAGTLFVLDDRAIAIIKVFEFAEFVECRPGSAAFGIQGIDLIQGFRHVRAIAEQQAHLQA